ncbi:MAG: fimbrillin family protein, partial [Bacteroides sp.]
MKRNHLFQSVCRTMRSLPMAVPAGAYSLILLAAMLTGCSKDQLQDGETLPDGKYPMTFTASVEGITTTRATGKDAWTSGDKVAIQIDAKAAQEYSADAAGKLSCTPPMYWQNTTETHTVHAWYPYAPVKPAAVTVKADQSIAANYLASDLLEAKETTLTFTNSNLTFTHRTAKVIVNLTAGADVTLDANTTVTLMNLTAVEGGATVVTPDKVDNTYTALLAPQNCSGRKFIKVTTDGHDYYYTPKMNEANFEAGNQYTYLVTVKKTGITVTVTGATAWGSGGASISVTGKTPKSGFFSPDLKIGDFYYSDGTTSDGGYREYTDNTTATLPIIPVLKAADGTPRNVIGLVFKAGKDNSDQGDYKDRNGNTMSTIHGYVLALVDAVGYNIAWAKENYESRSSVGTSKTNNDWKGYSNCQIIKAYTQNGCT